MKITNYQALILLGLEDTELHKGLWRPHLAAHLNTPTTTLFDNLKKLQVKKLVDNFEINNGYRGRNKVLWFATILGKKAIRVIEEGMKQ